MAHRHWAGGDNMSIVIKKVWHIERRETSWGVFYFTDFGCETHGRRSFRLWISSRLISQDEDGHDVVLLPVRATIDRTERGSLVLRPGKGWVFSFYVKCGHRGGSSFEVLEPAPIAVEKFRIFESPRGSLGISDGALVEVPSFPVWVRWNETGRLYCAPPEGVSQISQDLEVTDLDMVPGGLEELREIFSE